MSKISSLTKETLQDFFDNSSSYAEILIKIGLRTAGGNTATLKRHSIKKNIDMSLFFENIKKRKKENKKLTVSLTESSNSKRENVKKYLFANKIKEEQCEVCGIRTWNGTKISFHLHHKNGVHNDNRLNNLQILCPNCHSQTSNFAGKKLKKIIPKKPKENKNINNGRFSKEIIFDILITSKHLNNIEVGKKYNVSNSLIARIRKGKIYKQYFNEIKYCLVNNSKE